MNKKILIILAVVILLGAAAAVYFLVIAPANAAPAEEPVSTFVPGEYFVTNIKDSASLVKLTVVLEVNKAADDEEFQAFMTAHTYIIRDTVVKTVRSKTYEELTAEDLTPLGAELVQKINENLGIDNVKAIYFYDYVVQ